MPTLSNRAARAARGIARASGDSPFFPRNTSFTPGTPVANVQRMEFARVSSSVRSSTSDDGLILMDVAGGLLFAANPVGARIWQLLEQRCSCEEIVRQLTVDYEVTYDRAHADVVAFVDALRCRGLVTGEG